jgi:1-acyl-sn-glycerol-3-phosphate acyltransferase
MATFVLPQVTSARTAVVWSRFVIWWLKITCNVDYRVTGTEHLPSTPAVVLSKHQSAWETIAFTIIFPAQAGVVKRELLWIPFFGWSLAATRPIAIDRSRGIRALEQVVRSGTARLRGGRWVIVYPEGTRVKPGQRGRYNPGGAMLAVKAGVPAVPVAHNAGEFWPRHGFVKKPGTITVAIGPPIDTVGSRAKQVNAQAEAWIESAMAKLSA